MIFFFLAVVALIALVPRRLRHWAFTMGSCHCFLCRDDVKK